LRERLPKAEAVLHILRKNRPQLGLIATDYKFLQHGSFNGAWVDRGVLRLCNTLVNENTLLQPSRKLSRRQIIGASAALGLSGMLLKGGATPARAAVEGPRHLVWVWQFTTDAAPNLISARLRDHNLGLVIKTHDGVEWMSKYDKSPYAISGPGQIQTLAKYYEGEGVPFHAWAVVHGTDPIKEARMAADVLAAGARSIFLDIEPYAGFWRGTPADALAYGKELRRLQPDAKVVISIDPRPWVVDRIPMKEFASFSNEIAPQQYWRTFNTVANHTRFAETGFPVGPEGVTPEFLVTVSHKVLSQYGLPIIQVGQGATPDSGEWMRFLAGAYNAGANFVTVWRYGVTDPVVFNVLRDIPARQPAPPVTAVTETAGAHVVADGDTLGGIAAKYGTSVEAIMELNGLTDANYLYVGQELKVPGASGGSQTATQTHGGGSATSSSKHVVVEGDTLYGIAAKYSKSADAIVALNGLTDANFLSIGQELLIP
jgi:LysM repeat protein